MKGHKCNTVLLAASKLEKADDQMATKLQGREKKE